MAKRKMKEAVNGTAPRGAPVQKKSKTSAVAAAPPTASAATPTTRRTSLKSETIQLVVGSYDRILHGITVMTPASSSQSPTSSSGPASADFADTFLFSAHTAAIRCVATSAPSEPVRGQTQKVFLASGSSDERINVYSLSAHAPNRRKQNLLAKVAPRPILENSKNRELGTLLHHSSSITALRFPTRSKLLSSSEDSTIAVTRTRDWSTLSTIKAPKPKVQGRPSGDTAPFGGSPTGVNDFAVHPSMKLMISVSKGERSMRLWNLVTGKKAGVLNFDRDLLQQAGERKHSTGEGRAVVWGTVGGEEEFAVGFDRDVVVFGMDSVPKCRVMPSARTKIHKFDYVELLRGDTTSSCMAVATEDGRILFFSTEEADLSSQPATVSDASKKAGSVLRVAKPLGQLGGKGEGITSRIKDFVVVKSQLDAGMMYVLGGSSDGRIWAWRVMLDALRGAASQMKHTQNKKEQKKKQNGDENTAADDAGAGGADEFTSVGSLVGTYDTQSRITCMTGYMMIPREEGLDDESDEDEDEKEAGEEEGVDETGDESEESA